MTQKTFFDYRTQQLFIILLVAQENEQHTTQSQKILCVVYACARRMKKYLVYKQEAICQLGYESIRNALINRPTCNQIFFLLFLDDNF